MKNRITILLDNGHGIDTKGKCSPDKRLLEYAYTREITSMIEAELTKQGYEVRLIVPEKEDISLRERVKRVNTICSQHGKQNCLLVSVHCNASGSDGKWHNANGWSVFVSPNSSSKSKLLAQLLYKEAEQLGLKGNRYVPPCHYWVQSLAMCRDTNCPAVLTENMFQDNKQDVYFLVSEDGKRAITQLHVQGIINYIESISG